MGFLIGKSNRIDKKTNRINFNFNIFGYPPLWYCCLPKHCVLLSH